MNKTYIASMIAYNCFGIVVHTVYACKSDSLHSAEERALETAMKRWPIGLYEGHMVNVALLPDRFLENN